MAKIFVPNFVKNPSSFSQSETQDTNRQTQTQMVLYRKYNFYVRKDCWMAHDSPF